MSSTSNTRWPGVNVVPRRNSRSGLTVCAPFRIGGRDSELPRDFEREDDAAGGRTGHDIDARRREIFGEAATDRLSCPRLAEQIELFDVAVAVPAGGKQEVTILECAYIPQSIEQRL